MIRGISLHFHIHLFVYMLRALAAALLCTELQFSVNIFRTLIKGHLDFKKWWCCCNSEHCSTYTVTELPAQAPHMIRLIWTLKGFQWVSIMSPIQQEEQMALTLMRAHHSLFSNLFHCSDYKLLQRHCCQDVSPRKLFPTMLTPQRVYKLDI